MISTVGIDPVYYTSHQNTLKYKISVKKRLNHTADKIFIKLQ